MRTVRQMMASILVAVLSLFFASSTNAAAVGAGMAGGRGPFSGFRNAVMSTHSNALMRRCNRSAYCTPLQRAGMGGRGYAAVIPGDSFTEEVLVGGMLNFLSIYNILITGRVLLSWVPQLQGVQALQPVYLLTDPYLNAFRRLNLTFGGLDFSVLPAFLLLSFATNAVASLGAEMPNVVKGGAKWWHNRRADFTVRSRRFSAQDAEASAHAEPDAAPRRRLIGFRY